MEVKQTTRKPQKTLAKTEKIQFHRRSRYEDILDLVNDNEDALKPFPNRDAVFYKQSNKGSRFDGKDHLDKLKVQEKQIADRIARELMLRQYASDNDLTHRALFTQNDRADPQANAPQQPTTPEMFNIGTDVDNMSIVEEFGTPQEQQLMEINQTLQNMTTAQQANQQSITQAHQQQLEREEEGGSGVLRSLGSGALRIGGNIAGNIASGMDVRTAAFAGFSQEAMDTLRQTLMRRIAPPPRPLLDFTGERNPREFTTYETTPIPNMQYLQPTTILQPHQPNVGATQQPLPIAASSQPTISELPRPQRPTEPRVKSRPRPTPKTSPAPPQTNFQEGGASGSGENAPPPRQEENQDIRNLMRQVEEQNIFPVHGSDHSGLTDKYVARALAKLNLNDFSTIDPENLSFKTVVELFRIAKLRNNLSQTDEAKIMEIFNEINRERNISTNNSSDAKRLFTEIFRGRTPPTEEEPVRRGSRKPKKSISKNEEDVEPSTTLIIPSKIGIQKLREVFEEANNRNTINTRTYRNYRSIYNNWVKASGNKDMKKQYLQELKDLYRNNIYKK